MAQNPTAQKTKKEKNKSFSWTQPCCEECWDGLKLKTGRLTPSIHGTCCFCKNELDTDKRYTIRVNPGSVPYPTVEKEE